MSERMGKEVAIRDEVRRLLAAGVPLTVRAIVALAARMVNSPGEIEIAIGIIEEELGKSNTSSAELAFSFP